MRAARRAMATEFEIVMPHDCPVTHTDAAMAALDEIQRLEALLSVYQPLSTVSRLNASAGRNPLAVDYDTANVLTAALRIAELTGGAFDITAGPLVKAWGFMDRQGRKPAADELAAARELVGWQRLQWNPTKRIAELPLAGMQINFGGIGKGYAVDQAARVMVGASVPDFLIHGGQSSALARGRQHKDLPGWAVAVDHPTRSQVRIGRVFLQDKALATSGSGRQFFHFQGQRLGHVIDPRSGWPAGDLLSLTVITPTAMDADALATGMFVLGREKAFALAATLPDVGLIAVAPGKREGDVEISTFNVDRIWQAEPNVTA